MSYDLRKLGNIGKISNLGGDIAQPSAQSPLQNLNFGNSSQKHAEVDIKLFFSSPVLLDFSILVKYFVRDCRSRNEHKSTKYKMCLSIMMSICIKQKLSNILSLIHEKVKQH